MFLDQWLRQRDGIAHTSEIYAAGFGKHVVQRAVDEKRMLRVRRSWIALPDCDAALISAVRAGGRLTCVSAASRLGIWVPAGETAIHLSAPPGAGKLGGSGLRVHWSGGPAPVRERAPVEPLINVLQHAARCQEFPAALAIWESALNKKLIGAEVLSRIAWRGRQARLIAEMASSLSDSGLETEFIQLMRTLGVTVRQQVWIDGRPVDVLIGERLIVQLDGFAHHSDAAARRRDIEADVRLRLRGYTVFRFDYFQVFFQPEIVLGMIGAAIAQRLHLAA